MNNSKRPFNLSDSLISHAILFLPSGESLALHIQWVMYLWLSKEAGTKWKNNEMVCNRKWHLNLILMCISPTKTEIYAHTIYSMRQDLIFSRYMPPAFLRPKPGTVGGFNSTLLLRGGGSHGAPLSSLHRGCGNHRRKSRALLLSVLVVLVEFSRFH